MRYIKKLLISIKRYFFLRDIKHKGRNISLFFPLIIEGKENVTIGNNSQIGSYCHIWGNGGVIIGDDVLIAAHCCISSLNHDYSSDLIRTGKIIPKAVVIENNVWLGYNVTVLPGVKIGYGSVIGAGSVVANNIPPNSIAVGNPAKVIKKRLVNC
ncbi:acyltransferase [Bacteroides sedimenti]|uniref:Acyltransferase n=1 Tax=Bacteroides sedimenti TaxID=2136147 RepID=A0ABN6Z8X2_9BACE